MSPRSIASFAIVAATTARRCSRRATRASARRAATTSFVLERLDDRRQRVTEAAEAHQQIQHGDVPDEAEQRMHGIERHVDAARRRAPAAQRRERRDQRLLGACRR